MGKKRRVNEDRHNVMAYRVEENGTPALLAIVADGIGGHQAGDVAAQLTVETITQGVATFQGGDPLPCLQSLDKCSRVCESRWDGIHCGSCPHRWTAPLYCYGWGQSHLSTAAGPITSNIDRSYLGTRSDRLQHYLARKDHPQAHVIRRHIGGKQLPEPDIRMSLEDGENDSRAISNQGMHLKRGDRLLLCTDGLTDMVTDLEIYQALKDKPVEEAAETLLNLALDHGGHDNITMVVLAAPKGKHQERPRSKFGCLLAAVVSSLILILVTTLALGAVWWFGFWPWSP